MQGLETILRGNVNHPLPLLRNSFKTLRHKTEARVPEDNRDPKSHLNIRMSQLGANGIPDIEAPYTQKIVWGPKKPDPFQMYSRIAGWISYWPPRGSSAPGFACTSLLEEFHVFCV